MGLLKGGRRRLIEGGRLIQVTITACVLSIIWDFENWPLNTAQLCTGSTVLNNIHCA